MAVILVFLYAFNPTAGIKAFNITINNIWQLIKLVPPVFVLLGLMDLWVPREKMIKYMGEDSGLRGIILAFLIGSAAAGPLYAAFPMGALLIKKGAKFSNVMIFIGAWSTTKIPMVLIEGESLGWKFTITRLVVDIMGIIIIAAIINKVISNKEKQHIEILSRQY